MFVQISPSDRDSSETLSSLNFATRVRGLELGPARKQIDTGEIHKLKMMVYFCFHHCIGYHINYLFKDSLEFGTLNLLHFTIFFSVA